MVWVLISALAEEIGTPKANTSAITAVRKRCSSISSSLSPKQRRQKPKSLTYIASHTHAATIGHTGLIEMMSVKDDAWLTADAALTVWHQAQVGNVIIRSQASTSCRNDYDARTWRSRI